MGVLCWLAGAICVLNRVAIWIRCSVISADSFVRLVIDFRFVLS